MLHQEYQNQVIAAGGSAKGVESAFARHLNIHPSMWSQIKAARPISEFLARKIEVQCGRPAGWLDAMRGAPAVAAAAEERFIELARQVWRAEKPKEKRALRAMLSTRKRALEKEGRQEFTCDAPTGRDRPSVVLIGRSRPWERR